MDQRRLSLLLTSTNSKQNTTSQWIRIFRINCKSFRDPFRDAQWKKYNTIKCIYFNVIEMYNYIVSAYIISYGYYWWNTGYWKVFDGLG